MWVDMDDLRAELECLVRKKEEELAEEEDQYEFLQTLHVGTLLGYTNVETMLDELETVYRERESECVRGVKEDKMKNREKYREHILEWAVAPGRDICDFKRKEVLAHFGKEGCDGISCPWCAILLDLWLDEEYEEHEVDWGNVPVDTLVRVRNRKENEWVMRYFKGIDEKRNTYKFMVWTDGRTSKTVGGYGMETWKYCELVEVEDGITSI